MKPRFLPCLLLLPAATAVLYTLYTHQIWEDYLITIRHTENLVKGNGLVYQPGERIHGFTSVLNTLVPALPMLVSNSFDVALNFYRACSLATLLAGLYYLWRALGDKLGIGRLELTAGALLVACSVKIIAFTMNGQETGFLVGFLALGLGSALRSAEPGAWRVAGLAWAGLLYTRPDSPVYIAILAGIGIGMEKPKPWRTCLPGIVRATALAAVCYLPWLVFAWVYYGSPVPHTIVAKAADGVFVEGSALKTFVAVWNNYLEVAADAFGPIYGLGGWPELIGWAAILGSLVASMVWLFPKADRFARACSAGLLVMFLYCTWLRIQRDAYPWYFGPAALFASLIWCRLAFTGRTVVSKIALAGITLACVACFSLSLRHQRIHQVAVEENTRKAIGLWLKEKVSPGDTVYLEPIGYIGYYSQAKILDYPGLVSDEVVTTRRESHATFASLPALLKPNWIVARREEIELLKGTPGIVERYDWVKEFNTRDQLEPTYGRFPGELTVSHDLWYVILHRRPGP